MKLLGEEPVPVTLRPQKMLHGAALAGRLAINRYHY